MKDEALKLALDALENSVDLVREDAYNAEKLYGNYPSRQGKVAGLKVLADDHDKAITAIKQALATPVQEPVAWMHKETGLLRQANKAKGGDFEPNHWTPLYTTPPAAQPTTEKSSEVQPAAQPAPVQEPVKVGRITDNIKGMVLRQEVMLYTDDYLPIGTAIYTTPSAAPVPLTDEQILALWEDTYVQRGRTGIEFARAIESAHGITKGQ